MYVIIKKKEVKMDFKNSLETPNLAMGTWKLGENLEKEQEEINAIRYGIDAGIKMIDTAEMYGEGKAEELVGKAIEKYKREDLFLVSKVYPHNASKEKIFNSIENSLKRLKTSYLDLYLLHWRGNVPLQETVECMEKLVRDKTIKRWGVSNFDLLDMKELFLVPQGKNCAVNQVMYNLGSRGIEFDLKPWLDRNKIKIMAYSPLANGGERREKLVNNKVVRNIAKNHNVKELQILLAFLTNKNVIIVPGSGKIEHIRDNIDGCKINLSEKEMNLLDKEFPRPTSKVELDML